MRKVNFSLFSILIACVLLTSIVSASSYNTNCGTYGNCIPAGQISIKSFSSGYSLNSTSASNSFYWQGQTPQTFIPAFVAPSFTTFSYVNDNINNNISALSNVYVQIGNATSSFISYVGANKNIDLGSNNLNISGMVGIGVNPSKSFEIKSASNADTFQFFTDQYGGTMQTKTGAFGLYSGNGQIYFGNGVNQTSNLIGFFNAFNTYQISANGNTFFLGGNVGIGTGTPGGKFQVSSTYSDFYIDSTYGNTANFGYDTATDLGAWINYNGYHGVGVYNRDLYIGNGKQTAIATFIASTGNVGIGTITPSAKLDINGIVNASSYNVNGTIGATKTVTLVKNIDFVNSIQTNCTLIYLGGVYTGGTC